MFQQAEKCSLQVLLSTSLRRPVGRSCAESFSNVEERDERELLVTEPRPFNRETD